MVHILPLWNEIWHRQIKSYIDISLLKKAISFWYFNGTIHNKMFFIVNFFTNGAFISATGVLGLVCLPLSISNICELQRNFAIEWRCCAFLTRYRYGSIEYSDMIVLYVLKMIFNCKSCRFVTQVDTKLFLKMCLQLLANICYLRQWPDRDHLPASMHLLPKLLTLDCNYMFLPLRVSMW